MYYNPRGIPVKHNCANCGPAWKCYLLYLPYTNDKRKQAFTRKFFEGFNRNWSQNPGKQEKNSRLFKQYSCYYKASSYYYK